VYTVKLYLEAEIEIAKACEWYEKRKSGLGKRFLHEFDYFIQQISKNPYVFAVNFSEKYRFGLLKKFPYSVVYRFDGETVFIISVFHQHRNPSKFWYAIIVVSSIIQVSVYLDGMCHYVKLLRYT